MKKGNICLVILSFLMLMSCSSMKVVEYSIKRVPNISLSDTASVVLLYNVNHISVNDNQTILKEQDTIAQYIFTQMSIDLHSSKIYNDVKEYIIPTPTSQSLNKSDINEYGGEENNIISLNKVSINPHYRMGTVDDDWHFVDMFVPIELNITVSPQGVDSVVSYTCIDTLVFSGAGYTKQEAIASLPSSNECIENIVSNISKVASLQYIPQTENYARLYFVLGNRMMRKADKYWREAKYDEASCIWEYLYENKRSKKIQAKTAANMAMYEEMKHNYDKSLMWARISFALHSRRKSVYDPQIAYLSDYIQQLRLDLKEQQDKMKINTYRFE